MALYSAVKYSVVKNHRSYTKAMRLAALYLRDPDEVNRLIADAQEKLTAAANRALREVSDGFDTLLRMLRAYASGEYRGIPWRTLLIITAAVIYFVMPLDFIPDMLPMIGLADDLAIIAWTLNQVKLDMDKFRAWEAEQANATTLLPDSPPAQ